MYAIFFSILSVIYASDIYSYTAPATAAGAPIQFSAFKGKKILIVNTATGSPLAAQFGSLEQLYQQYKGQLVIVAVPSNDFQQEPRSDQDIQSFLQNTYHIHYLVADKAVVTGTGMCDLYAWLTSFDVNGTMGSSVQKDFQKYLVGADGHLIGYFNGAVDPMDPNLQSAIVN